METNFNFNSQICTDKNQSERLLALGLKKETADMAHETVFIINAWIITPFKWEGNDINEFRIPAWSLHRLIEMKQPNKIDNAAVVLSREQTYDKLIGMIAKSIKGGNFPKEYLVNSAEIDEHCKGVLEYLDYIRGEEE